MAGLPEARAFVEVKRASLVHHGRAHCIARILAAIAPVLERCAVISFDADAVRLARATGRVPIGWVLGWRPGLQLRPVLELMNPEYVFCDHRRLPAGRAPPAGRWAWVAYEVTDAGQALELAGRGIAMVESMAPLRLAAEMAARHATRMTGDVHVAIDQGGHATRASAYVRRRHARGRRARHDRDAAQRPRPRRARSGGARRQRRHRARGARADRRAVARWAAAGLAVQRSSLVCWNAEDGRALSPVLSWQDTRGAAWLRGLSRRAEDVQRLTGLPLSPHYGASKLRWCLDHLPEVRAAAAQSRLAAGPLAAYLLHRLLEERPFLADASTAARTLLWSPFERDWSAELLELFGIPREVLPQATGTSHRFGTLAFGGARVPVVVCNGDQSVVPYAAGPLDFDAAYVNLGTGAFVLRPTTEALHAPPLLTSLIRADGEHADFVLEGSVNGAGRRSPGSSITRAPRRTACSPCSATRNSSTMPRRSS